MSGEGVIAASVVGTGIGLLVAGAIVQILSMMLDSLEEIRFTLQQRPR